MKTEELTINAALQISKPVHEVFEATIDPAQMSNYFIFEGRYGSKLEKLFSDVSLNSMVRHRSVWVK
ncbi:MAG: hypothetical protein LBV72_08240 [Tannerella sp.]|jgi:uncharacterized protein YndB with AHSA1/START domain|nr:hypothetical protein [Tannerella sp.]